MVCVVCQRDLEDTLVVGLNKADLALTPAWLAMWVRCFHLGYPQLQPLEQYLLDNMPVWSPDNHRWFTPKISGTVPGARDGHSACILGKAMYIFGGYEQLVRILDL